jgi:hypothetical protein
MRTTCNVCILPILNQTLCCLSSDKDVSTLFKTGALSNLSPRLQRTSFSARRAFSRGDPREGCQLGQHHRLVWCLFGFVGVCFCCGRCDCDNCLMSAPRRPNTFSLVGLYTVQSLVCLSCTTIKARPRLLTLF